MNGKRKSVETFSPGVYMLTGINGIGKSTLVDAITNDHPETVPIHASQELRNLFGNITREELELLSPKEKLSRMVTHFTTIFEQRVNENKAVMMDTHLVIPIRNGNSLLYEDIWSDEYVPHLSAMAMLSATPESVRQWRLEDEVITGRKRNIDIDDIATDQEINFGRFDQLLSSGRLPARSSIVENRSSQIDEARLNVERIFHGI